MKKLILLLLILIVSISAKPKRRDDSGIREVYIRELTHSPKIQGFCDMVSMDTIIANLRYIQERGPHYSWKDSTVTDSAMNLALNEVRDWLIDKLEAYSYTVSTQDVIFYDTCDYGQNVITYKTGTKYPNTWIMIGGHYDSVLKGPGVNDNGSGVAAILEIARIYSKLESEYSIALIFFTGEERALKGSKAFVDSIGAEMDIKVMFNIDQVGGMSNKFGTPWDMENILCEMDSTASGGTENNLPSYRYTDTLAMATNTYSTVNTVFARAYGSDYVHFERKGYVVTGYYEDVDGGNYYEHSKRDTLGNLDTNYLTEVTKGAVAFSAVVGRWIEGNVYINEPNKISTCTNIGTINNNSNFKVNFQLNSSGNVNVELYNISGRKLDNKNLGYLNSGYHTLIFNNKFASEMIIVNILVDGKAIGKFKAVIIR